MKEAAPCEMDRMSAKSTIGIQITSRCNSRGDRAKRGSVLIIMLVTMAIIGISLGSYLHLVSNQNLSIMRSMAWNSAISVAEAGVEEAMAHLNANTTNRVQDGWSSNGTNVVKERVLAGNRYRVFINRDIDPPQVLAEAYALHPRTGQFLPPRSIRVTTTNESLFVKGLVAKGQIDLSGNRIKTDSYDSSDPQFSTGGRYDPRKTKDGGDIATNSSLVDSLNVWNAEIMGKASTGPGGTVRIGQNGSVGSKSWHSAGRKGIEPGWAKDDMNVHFPDVKAPFTGGGFSPLPGVHSGTSYRYVLGSGNYQLNELKLQGTETMLVSGLAVLYVTSDIDISGSAKIEILAGSMLHLYMGGPSTRIAGNGVVNNGSASAFAYWGLPRNTHVAIAGNASLTGTIYAPQASLTIGGGGADIYDVMGAAIASSVKLNGHSNFHYDESLRIFGPKRGYTITSWNEAGW
jgi:hypothetical protein